MLIEIMTGILGIVFLAGAVMQFRCTGPIWSLEYIAAAELDRKKMRKSEEYYWHSAACFLIGLSFLLVMVYCLTELKGFLYVVFVLAGILFLIIVYGAMRAMHKSTDRSEERDMKRRRNR